MKLGMRFSLKAALVVMTLACACAAIFAHHLNWIRRRHEALKTGEVLAVPILGSSGTPARAPGVLSLFGETGESVLIVQSDDEATWREQQRVLAELFPEAEIHRDHGDPVFQEAIPAFTQKQAD